MDFFHRLIQGFLGGFPLLLELRDLFVARSEHLLKSRRVFFRELPQAVYLRSLEGPRWIQGVFHKYLITPDSWLPFFEVQGDTCSILVRKLFLC